MYKTRSSQGLSDVVDSYTVQKKPIDFDKQNFNVTSNIGQTKIFAIYDFVADELFVI